MNQKDLPELDKLMSVLDSKASGSSLEAESEVTDALDKIAEENQSKCDHGVVFNLEEARILLESVKPDPSLDPAVAFIMGPPGAALVRKKFPRLEGTCPKGCGFKGIAYASYQHYIYGDW